MQKTRLKIIAEKKFKSRVVKETAYGIVDDYGVKDNTMQLMRLEDALLIEWVVGDSEDVVVIGVKWRNDIHEN